MSEFNKIEEYSEKISDTVIKKYVKFFNRVDDEFVKQYIPNNHAEEFLLKSIPRFECPDPILERIYYFRWWTFRKHIKETEHGFVFSEFLPSVPWAGVDNTIVCAAGYHLAEARWLSERKYAEDYLRFWFHEGKKHLHDYSSWFPFAAVQLASVTGDDSILKELLPAFIEDVEQWEQGITVYGGNVVSKHGNGLYYSYDFFDGGEISVGGHGYRPLFNTAFCACLQSIADIAHLVGDAQTEEKFRRKADEMKQKIQTLLWDDTQKFFVVHDADGKARNARELYGYAPWYFGIADENYAENFLLLRDPHGFNAPYGPTIVEQRNPDFALNYSGHECQWNGPSWPYSTSLTLGAVENLLNDYENCPIDHSDYYNLLHTYAASHQRIKENGEQIPWIDENLNPYTGDWISRTRLKTWENGSWCTGKGGYERGKDYNHSMFCNHVISGIVGVRPTLSNRLTLNPLIGEKEWPWFCLENLNYHGHRIDIVWDKTGEKYHGISGFSVWKDGIMVKNTPELKKMTLDLELE